MAHLASVSLARPFSPDAFAPPLVVSARNPVIGNNVAVSSRQPFLSQPPVRGLLLHTPRADNTDITATDNRHASVFGNAVSLVARDPEEAGRLFKRVRAEREYIVGADPLYVEAAFGEALYGCVDGSTFGALRRIRMNAEGRNQELACRELIMRSVAAARIGDDTSALGSLVQFGHNGKQEKNPDYQVMGLMMYANLLVARAIRHTGATRNDALQTLVSVMEDDLPRPAARMNSLCNKADAGKLGHGKKGKKRWLRAVAASNTQLAERLRKVWSDGLADATGKLYIFVSEFLLQQGRPLDAIRVIQHGRHLFPNHPNIEQLFNTAEGPGSPGEYSPFKQLLSGEGSTGVAMFDHLYAGATEFLHHAKFPNNRAFWKAASLGGVIGALAGSVAALATNDPEPFASALMYCGVGATTAVAAGKVRHALDTEEPKQAFLAGYTTHKLSHEFAVEFAKLFGTYAFFGGAIPLAAYVLPAGLLADTNGGWGQIHGLGSIFTRAARAVVQRLHEVGFYLGQQGSPGGLAELWDYWVRDSYTFEAIDNALHFQVGKAFSAENRLPDFLRHFSFASPGEAAASLAVAGLYGYMGASVLYAAVTMVPAAKAYLKNILPTTTDKYIFPGALIGTSALMAVSGVKLFDAILYTLICYAVQYRHYVQGGGDWMVFKPEVFRKLDLGGFMRAGAVQLLYIGPGNAIKPDIPRLDWGTADFNAIAQYTLDNVDAHFGMVWFLAALGVFHAVATGLSIPQTLKAKYAKAATWEIPANVANLMLGWTSFWGLVSKLFIKEFQFGAIVSQCFREAGGSPLQQGTFRHLLADVANQSPQLMLVSNVEAGAGENEAAGLAAEMHDNARMLRTRGVRAARLGEAYEFIEQELSAKRPPDQMLLLTDLYYIEPDHRVLLGPTPDKKWYVDIVYRALTDPETKTQDVERYLQRLSVIAMDANPDLKHVRQNLLVATMRAIGGVAHGKKLRDFFESEKGSAIAKSCGVEKELAEALEIRSSEGENRWRAGAILPGPARWIVQRLRKAPKSPVQKFYDAMATAGRRYSFSGLFDGRSLVENASAFTTFLLSASQADPPFQTWGDVTLYRDTLHRLLMTPPSEVGETTESYQSKVVNPILAAATSICGQLGDGRRDIRHNLLITIYFAAQGPHGAVIRDWVNLNKHLFQANDIYGLAVASGSNDVNVNGVKFPRTWRERKLIKELFGRHMSNSDASTDGTRVYPGRPWPRLKWN